MSAAPVAVTERQLEEGLSGPAPTGAAAGGAPAPSAGGAHTAAAKQQREHHRRRHHARERLHLRRKQRVEKKLPAIMQGAGDLAQARRRLTIKNEIVAALGEFCGTFLFLFFSLGIATIAGQQNLTANSAQQVQDTGGASTSTSLDASQLLYSSLGFAFALAVNAWLFFRISGGLFNPAVTLALFLTQNLTWYRTLILGTVQFVAAIAAAGMAQVLVPGGINARTKLAGSTSIAQGFFIEVFMTAQLVFAVFMLAGEKHKGTFLAPVGIGLSLFIAELWATPFTGGSLNPARSLGPDVIAAHFEGTAWIYYTAPFVGALLATAVYRLLRVLKYETAVAGQDDEGQLLILRNKEGAVTGFVDQVAAEDAPEVVQKAGSVPPSPSASMYNLRDSIATTAATTAAEPHAPFPGAQAAGPAPPLAHAALPGTGAVAVPLHAGAGASAPFAHEHDHEHVTTSDESSRAGLHAGEFREKDFVAL